MAYSEYFGGKNVSETTPECNNRSVSFKGGNPLKSLIFIIIIIT